MTNQWFIKRNARSSEGVASSYSWTAVIFNPASAAAGIPNATVRLLKVTPVCVEDARWNPLPKNEKVLRGSMAIDTSGNPQEIVMETKSASAQALLPCIKKSAAQWSFAPARANGQPVASVIKTTFITMPVPGTMGSIRSNRIPPRPIMARAPPVYPVTAKKLGVSATVFLYFVVNKKGGTENIKVTKVSFRPNSVKDGKIAEALLTAFSTAAVNCVKKWKFAPATFDGAPVAVPIEQPIAFNFSN
jgi:outer membrane biosynthesis protein TonB